MMTELEIVLSWRRASFSFCERLSLPLGKWL